MKNIKKYAILIISAVFIYTNAAHAAIFMQVTGRTGTWFGGTFDYELLDWSTDDNTPNPCYKKTKCRIMITSSHNASPSPPAAYIGGLWSGNKDPWVSNSATIGILGQNFKQFVGIPRSGSFRYDNIFGGSGCVGFFYNSGDFMDPVIPRLPGSICAIPPEEKNTCEIKTPQLTLNHGVLAPEQLNNNTATDSLLLACNQKTNIQLYISEGTGGVMLRSDGSLFSNLKLNGQPASKGIALSVGPTGTSVQVSSVLRTVGNVEAGPFQGSAVALLALP